MRLGDSTAEGCGDFSRAAPQLAQKLFPLRLAVPQAGQVCCPVLSDSAFTFTDSSALWSSESRCIAWKSAALDSGPSLGSRMACLSSPCEPCPPFLQAAESWGGGI